MTLSFAFLTFFFEELLELLELLEPELLELLELELLELLELELPSEPTA